MFKTVFSAALGFILVGAIVFGVRLWIFGESVKQINTVIQQVTTQNINRIKTLAMTQQPLSINNNSPVSDQLDPRSNAQDWDSISNDRLFCWIHKKSHKKVCEKRL